jgi:hypothetical protein
MRKELKMGKCREEFELFWTARCCGLGIECNLTTLINGDYYDMKVYYAWIGWRESRESMKAIKLPDLNAMCISTTAKNKIISAITSAGYKVEE